MPDVLWHPSANFGDRRGVAAPDMVVLHYTAMQSAEAARDWLCAPESEVSCHYVIAEDGRVWQLVRDENRAWHAGRGAWGAIRDVNSHSIGVELANTGFHPFPEPQMRALEALLVRLKRCWSILPHRVVGHSDTALGRKIDPGGRFDWRRLARQDLAVWPEVRAADPVAARFAEDCRRFGYDWTEENADLVLCAVRLRFRPWVTGRLDGWDCGIMADLAARYPCRGVTGV